MTNPSMSSRPRAWLITVPASSFDYGADLSPVARAGVASALHEIRYLLTSVCSRRR